MKFDYDSQLLLIPKVGIIRLTACPVTKLSYFSDLMSFLTSFLQSEEISLELGLQVTEVEWVVNELLKCHGLDYSQLEVEQLNQLLNYPDGLLVKMNRLSPKETKEIASEDVISLKEYELKQVARLVNFELAKDFEQAYRIADTYPADYLDSIINARLTYLNPDAEKQALKEHDNIALLAELNQEMQGDNAIKFITKKG